MARTSLSKYFKKFTSEKVIFVQLNLDSLYEKILRVVITFSVVVLLLTKSIWFFLAVTGLGLVSMILIVNMIVIRKYNKVIEYFPVAIGVFLDQYMEATSIRQSFYKSLPEIPRELKPLFDWISKSLATTTNTKESLIEFQKKFDDENINQFIELLIISVDTKNVHEEITKLSNSIQEEIERTNDRKSDVAFARISFYVITAFSLAGLGFTYAYFPEMQLYYLSPAGLKSVLGFGVCTLLGFVSMTLLPYY
ncbi:MAG: hypothetical protein N4A40_13305 [Tissierellales bacterium]|nr:hypothetical protein [Tissierellales bacterium]